MILSRTDWEATQPTAPTKQDRIASQYVSDLIASSDVTRANTPQGGLAPQFPVSGEENDLVLVDLRGLSYDDPTWDALLNKLKFDDAELYRKLLFQAAYQTGALPEIQKPSSTELDGPQGLTRPDTSGRNWIKDVCAYPCAPVLASTWNQPMLYELGAMIAQEALLKDINGWYAPGLNLIRSPFCGRTSEYFSEDPMLAGLLGAQLVSGAGDNGLYCAIKHLCLMETEAHRSPTTCNWLTEQALREIYLKPFELVIKRAYKTIRYEP